MAAGIRLREGRFEVFDRSTQQRVSIWDDLSDAKQALRELTDVTDFSVRDHGSIIVLTPQTDAAREWVGENIDTDAWMGGVCIERRFFGNIYEGLTADGLSIS